MSAREFAILEGYPDGGTWTHYFNDPVMARLNLRALRMAHPWREYIAIGFDDEVRS